MEAKSCFRVLFFPWLAHGHVFPFLELAKALSKNNFQIYFCSTVVNLDSVKKSLRKNASDDVSIELVELQLPSMSELPPQYHTTKNIPAHLMPTLMQSFQMSSSSFSKIISSIKPDLLIYDGFQPWAAKFASSKGIPSVLFATSGSTALSFFHHLHTYKGYATFPYPAIYLHEHEKRDLISQGKSIKIEDAEEGFSFGTFQLSCDIVLIKSCRGIEGKYLDYFSKLCNKKIIPVGPLIIHSNKENSSEIFQWLNEKNESSVLYISFGSENYLSKEQMGEIAKGLELSNVNFIWVARFPDESSIINIEESLPLGFLQRVTQRGIFVHGWAPQTEILAHTSVGGFMSHCGWSSIVESVYFGVPVVAVPLKLDQPVNSRLVVEIGVGVEVRRDDNGKFSGEEVAKAIDKVIGKKSGERFRCKVRNLRENMKMEEEGALHEVVQILSSICISKLVLRYATCSFLF